MDTLSKQCILAFFLTDIVLPRFEITFRAILRAILRVYEHYELLCNQTGNITGKTVFKETGCVTMISIEF